MKRASPKDREKKSRKGGKEKQQYRPSKGAESGRSGASDKRPAEAAPDRNDGPGTSDELGADRGLSQREEPAAHPHRKPASNADGDDDDAGAADADATDDDADAGPADRGLNDE